MQCSSFEDVLKYVKISTCLFPYVYKPRVLAPDDRPSRPKSLEIIILKVGSV